MLTVTKATHIGCAIKLLIYSKRQLPIEQQSLFKWFIKIFTLFCCLTPAHRWCLHHPRRRWLLISHHKSWLSWANEQRATNKLTSSGHVNYKNKMPFDRKYSFDTWRRFSSEQRVHKIWYWVLFYWILRLIHWLHGDISDICGCFILSQIFFSSHQWQQSNKWSQGSRGDRRFWIIYNF